MNLRLSKNSIRFRITKEELSLLQSNKSLEEKVFLPNSEIIFKIVIANCQEIELSSNNNIVTLAISNSSLQFLIENFPSKDGISKELTFNDNKLKVVLEIDVFKRRKTI